MTEHERIQEARTAGVPWRKWGPYLSERQWGSVREDYSAGGTAWDYFTFDQSRSRAYKWGEDGIAGFSDEHQRLCFALALWNGHDPFLKERIFGLTNSEGNHGEDCKDYYFYLDSTPTHSYMRMLYKYPHAAFPYDDLRRVNRERSRHDPEFELIDTGIFKAGYFDVFVEYAKRTPEDVAIKITAVNRGDRSATLHLLPHLWFRNTWWREGQAPKPSVAAATGAIIAEHHALGTRYLYVDGSPELLFTENETNAYKLWGGDNPTFFVKDGFDEYVVNGRHDLVNPARCGTKSAAHYVFELGPSQTCSIRLRLTPEPQTAAFAAFDELVAQRKDESDAFYAALRPADVDDDRANVMRQGFAGLLWSKQTYIYDVYHWLDEHGSNPVRGATNTGRNSDWYHMVNNDVISMPDKWEYPWFAAWDLAFHTIALATVDPDFAWQQLELMLTDRFLHPNGQIPAYEWSFGDVNPPVHAFATIFNYWISRDRFGAAALPRLKTMFSKLMLNFSWWTNRKDPSGRNVFEGGFLGLDNIGVFDRSAPLPTGGSIEQADGTAWMALFAQNMLQIAAELAETDSSYDEIATKFYEHFIWIATALTRLGGADSLWDEEDGFFYDVLRLPNGKGVRMKTRSLVGLIPFCAVSVFEPRHLAHMPGFTERAQWFNAHRSELMTDLHPPEQEGVNGRFMLSVLTEERLRRVLARMLDPERFLSDYGIRSLSRWHLEHPFVVDIQGREYRVDYTPAESITGDFGGNSNWRGPVWMPINVLIIRALLSYYLYYGSEFTIECPTGSGRMMNLFEVAQELVGRLTRIFLRDADGRRPVFGGAETFQTDPYWRDNILFYEYFHGDNGAGIGATHQTGWTALVSGLIRFFGDLTAEELLENGVIAGADRLLPNVSSP